MLLESYNPGDTEDVHAVFVGGASAPGRVRAFVDSLAGRLAVKRSSGSA
jgi:hypothetical protein